MKSHTGRTVIQISEKFVFEDTGAEYSAEWKRGDDGKALFWDFVALEYVTVEVAHSRGFYV